jgi:hypothetical protein
MLLKRAAPMPIIIEMNIVAMATSLSPTGGARRDRTDDLLLAKQALSQLSYGPSPGSVISNGLGGPGKI